ncbi:16S RNA G1207 methylase RsmC [Pseudoclavibacter endophyticus]|uniref:Methyltransferase n=1 Tax=Pseudoclavibacter endophyticus TaxID=1778590 RepID=A0A6H9WJL0_9MICO|nr:methyltransferase [Pseudoclavibacter endophyticus]KAB1649016.1 methyltransferase [Pseudoclavibacter endophyticus]GGA66188.1 16S RNA G1207 methylase RsmC [Pseudoclavibacter endophyticus]
MSSSRPPEAAWSTAQRDAFTLDPVDLIALDEAADARARQAELVAAGADGPGRPPRTRLVVIGDRTGHLSFAAADRFRLHEVRVFTDGVDAERRMDELAAARAADTTQPRVAVRRFGLEPALVQGATLIVGRLPKYHAELEALTALAASHADERVRVVLGGRVKHMSRGLNEVLAMGFAEVRASLGRQKSRALHAAAPRRDHVIEPFPRWSRIDELGLEVAAHGGTFAGGSLDIGTRALLDVLEHALQMSGLGDDHVGIGVDLGCGTGLLAVALARARPRMRVIATDRSWAACASARATLERVGLDARVTVMRDDAASSIEAASTDLVLLNPPFHEGTELDDTAAEPLFAAAARILKPGGSLVTVFNAHLPHRTALRRIVGPTEQLSRTRKFVVTRSVVADRAASSRPRGRARA